MKAFELKKILNGIPDDAEISINSIYTAAGESSPSPVLDTVYKPEIKNLFLTPEIVAIGEDNKIIKTIVATERWGDGLQTIVLSFEVPYEDFDVIDACRKAAIAYCQTPEGFETYTKTNCHHFNWGDFEVNVSNSVLERFGLKRIYDDSCDLEVDLNEQLLDLEDILCKDDKERLYRVSLVNYTEDNIPEPGVEVIVRTNKNIKEVPSFILKEYLYEMLEENNCEGIGTILDIEDAELDEDEKTAVYHY